MEDRVNKPKRKKCSGSGKLSIPKDHKAFGGVHHFCPDCNCCVEITAKSYINPCTVRPHMVNVRQEVRPTLRAVDWAKAGEDYTVEATFKNGELVSERVIRPATNA